MDFSRATVANLKSKLNTSAEESSNRLKSEMERLKTQYEERLRKLKVLLKHKLFSILAIFSLYFNLRLRRIIKKLFYIILQFVFETFLLKVWSHFQTELEKDFSDQLEFKEKETAKLKRDSDQKVTELEEHISHLKRNISKPPKCEKLLLITSSFRTFNLNLCHFGIHYYLLLAPCLVCWK